MFDTFIPSSLEDNGIEAGQSGENSEMASMREALGAVPCAAPASYRVYASGDGNWQVRRDGDEKTESYPSREEAVGFARLAVIRCTAYRLLLQEESGGFTDEHFNWPA